jgi:ABC-type molybdate transport system substrate-binding protein
VGIATSSKHKQAAQAFIDFVTSAQGAKILQQYGFGIPAHP